MTGSGPGKSAGRRAKQSAALILAVLTVSTAGLRADQESGVAAVTHAVFVDASSGDDTWSGLCQHWDGGTCGPKATIQAGIDAASPGDEVVLADGVYTGVGNKNIIFAGKAITVRSAGGDPAACVVDCEDDGQAFLFYDGEGADSILRGLTVRNAFHEYGGIHCVGASPTILHCVVERCECTFGAGILCEFSSSPRIEHCVLAENFASRGGGIGCAYDSKPTIVNCVMRDNIAAYGAGVWCLEGSDATLVDCVIRGNKYSDFGAGVDCDVSKPTLTRCRIIENRADYGGGGVHCRTAYPTLIDCVIADNHGGECGGGISCRYGAGPMVTHCVITGNGANNSGGGVFCSDSTAFLTDCRVQDNYANYGAGMECLSLSSPMLSNCLITGNAASGRGGAVRCQESDMTLNSCVIAGNSAGEWGGGVGFELDVHSCLVNCTLVGNTSVIGGAVACMSDSAPTLVNCVLWANAPTQIEVESTAPVVTYCDIQGGWPGEGNINANPAFRDPAGPDGDPFTFGDNDYRLLPGSPCVDAGDNAAIPLDVFDLDGNGDAAEPWPFDVAGRPRQMDDPGAVDTGAGLAPLVDMGAYEERLEGDADGDWRIDLGDFASFAACLRGPTAAAATGCDWADIGIDGDVDLQDFAEFQEAFGR